MKKLVLSFVRSTDCANSIILLGFWCLFYRKDLDFDSIDHVGYPLQTKKDYDAIEAVLLKNFHYWVSDLGLWLNTKLKLNYPYVFWEVYLASYVSCLAELVLISKLRIDCCIRKFGKQWFYEREDIKKFRFKSISDFLSTRDVDVFFHAAIFSEVIKHYFPDIPSVEGVDDVLRCRKLTSDELTSRGGIFTKIRYKIANGIPICGIYGSGCFSRLFLSLFLLFSSCFHTTIKDSNKLSFTPSCHRDRQYYFILELLKKLLPQDVLNEDSYTNIKKLNFSFMIVNGTKLSSSDDRFAKRISKYISTGGRVFGLQHGSMYGYLRTIPSTYFTELIHSHFLSWGWSSWGDYKCTYPVMSLPSPLVSSFFKNRTDIINVFLFVGTISALCARDLCSCREENIGVYMEDKKVFLASLLVHVFEHCEYRPYPNNPYPDYEYLLGYFNDLKLCSGNFHKKVKKARLVVLDHPGTTMNFTLAGNIPTIAFWRKDSCIFSEEAQGDFDLLADCGVIWYSPTDAAKFINKHYQNIEDWWWSDKVQYSVRNWVAKYACTSKFWIWDWMQFIWKVSKNKHDE